MLQGRAVSGRKDREDGQGLDRQRSRHLRVIILVLLFLLLLPLGFALLLFLRSELLFLLLARMNRSEILIPPPLYSPPVS